MVVLSGRWRRHRRARPRATIVSPDGVADLAWVRGPGLFDRLYHDARWRQGACFFSQRAAEDFHRRIVHLLAAKFGQQTPHLGDVLFVAPALLSALLKHRRAARRSTTWSGSTHTWTRRAHPRPWWTRSSGRPRSTRRWSLSTNDARGRRSEIGLEFARASAASTARTARSTGSTSLAAGFTFATMLAPRRTPPIAIELPIGVKLVGLQIAIDRLAAWTRSPPARGGLDDDERRLFLRGHLSRRQSSLLQGRELTEKCFLE